LTSKQRRNFPVPIGVIMLPLLLASALGIVFSGFNIIFYYNSNTNSAPIVSQNSNVRTDAAHANLRKASADVVSPRQNPDTARTATGTTNNVRVAVPVSRAQPQRTEVRRTEPAVNVSPPARTQGWSIQAGAFTIESSAVRIKERVESMGYNARIVKSGTDKPLFRVIVSAGNSGASPDDALKRMNSAGIEGYIVSRRP